MTGYLKRARARIATGRIGESDFLDLRVADFHWIVAVDDDGVRLALSGAGEPPGQWKETVGCAEGLVPLEIKRVLVELSIADPTPGLQVIPPAAHWAIHEAAFKGAEPTPQSIAEIHAELMDAGLRTLVGRLGEGRLRLYLRVQHLTGEPNSIIASQSNIMTLNSTDMIALEDFVAAMPFAEELALLTALPSIPDRAEDVLAALVEANGLPKAILRRLSSSPGSPFGLAEACLARNVPVDWIPSADARSWRAFRVVAHLTERFEVTGLLRGMVAQSQGRWEEYVRRLASDSGYDLEAILSENVDDPKAGSDTLAAFLGVAYDMIDAMVRLQQEVVLPLVAHVAALESDCDPGSVQRINPFGAELFIGARGLTTVMEATRAWHAAERRGPRAPRATWPETFPRWVHPETGIEVRELTSVDELEAEGGRGPDSDGIKGMDHCVADYWRNCHQGLCQILTLRRDCMRLSTVEIQMGEDWRSIGAGDDQKLLSNVPRVVQHRSRANAEPTRDAISALAAYMALPEVMDAAMGFDVTTIRAGGTILHDPDAMPVDPLDPETVMRPYRLWTPFLPGRYAKLGIDGLREMVRSRKVP